jgi:hypothetical protein
MGMRSFVGNATNTDQQDIPPAKQAEDPGLWLLSTTTIHGFKMQKITKATVDFQHTNGISRPCPTLARKKKEQTPEPVVPSRRVVVK